jgi:hypothetical protein
MSRSKVLLKLTVRGGHQLIMVFTLSLQFLVLLLELTFILPALFLSKIIDDTQEATDQRCVG